jgi:hypothetical protein
MHIDDLKSPPQAAVTIAPLLTVQDVRDSRHPMFDIVVPWTDGSYTYRGRRVAPLEYERAFTFFEQLSGENPTIRSDGCTLAYAYRWIVPRLCRLLDDLEPARDRGYDDMCF